MRACRAWPCWLACLLPWCAVDAALPVAVDTRGLTAEQSEQTLQLVLAAEALLPPGFGDAFADGIVLRWRDDLPDRVHGRAQGSRIGLRRALLDGWMQHPAGSDETSDGPHPALAALLHELAHAYDGSPRGGLSRDPRLLDLAGWPVRPLRAGLRQARNDFRDRSPDAYEMASPAEYVAVNFEHFLLDPEYACRRPALHAYFAAHFDWSPPRAACISALPFVGVAGDDAAIGLLELDPARVHAVDYLFAESDARPMSRWGHAMLRLVVCAPGRADGPDCRLDLEHHVVLSFRAFVDDVQVSNWRGLTGSYPSRLFVLPLHQVVDEYTRVELRGLRSLPLRLDRDELASLLLRAAQVHWSYDGRYYFAGNNCAVEIWKLLNDSVPRLSGRSLRSITPTGLLRRLQREGIADGAVFADDAEAVRLGYRFESQAVHFDAMFEVVDTELGVGLADARGWLEADPGARAGWMERGSLRASAALLLLEQAALRREEAMAREDLKQRYLRGRHAMTDDTATAAVAALKELFGNGAYAGRPAVLLEGLGYGLPQGPERAALTAAISAGDDRVRGVRSALETHARALLMAERRQRLERIEANLATLTTRLRLLNAGSPSRHPREGGDPRTLSSRG